MAKVNEALIHASGNALSGIISGADTYLTQRIDASGNKVSGVLTALDTYLTQRIDASGNKVSGAVVDTRAFALSSAVASGNSAIIESSGWTNSVSGYVDSRLGGLGGGYGQWKISASGGANNNTHVQDDISSNNSVHFMGVSGLVADYTSSSNIMRLAAPGLSGDLLDHITNSGNKAFGDASGVAMDASGALKLRIDGLGGGYGQWKVSASGGANYDTHVQENISSSNSVHFLGVSGLVADYSAASNEFRFAAPGLSGDIMQHITNSGNRSIADASGWTNSVSGYFDTRRGGLAAGYGHWKVSASGGASYTTNI